MAHIKRNYIDSHWLVFVFQGLIAVLIGAATLFTGGSSSKSLIPLIGISMVALAVVELANAVYRSYNRHGWLVSAGVALYDAVFGIVLLFMVNESMAWHLALIALYVTLRGIFELIIAARTTVDPTDRFIWALCGVCGIIFGIVILNSGHLANVDFVRFFGAYMLILGISCWIYSAANREQQREDRLARSEAAKKVAAKSAKAPKKAKKGKK